MAIPAPPTNVVATVDSNDQITLSWDHDPTWFAFDGDDSSLGGFNEGRWYSSEVVDHFEIELSRDGIGYKDPSGGPTTVSYSSGQTSYSAKFFPNSDSAYGTQVGIDSMFKFRVRAVNSDGSSGWEASGLAYTKPIPPKNPSINRPDGNTIEVSYTNASDWAGHSTIELREDTGSGYGNWNEVYHQTGESKGNRYTATFQIGGNLQEDARYQFRIYHHEYRDVDNDGSNERNESKPTYADYGNYGNVYFEDDFESGDLSAWDTKNLAGESGIFTASDINDEADLGISDADEGTYFFQADSNGDIRKNLGDLSGETDVLVKCAMAAGSMDSSSEGIRILWYDGSSWQQLERFSAEMNQQGWVEVTVLVPDSWLSTDNRLRLDGYGGGGDYGAWDRVVVSDLLHEYTKPAAPTNPTTDSSSEGQLTLDWTRNSAFASEEEFTRVYGSGNSFKKRFNDSPWTWTGLKDGEKYEWYPSAVVGQPRHGEFNSWHRANGPTETATTILPAPSSPTASGVSDSSLNISWSDEANNEDGHRVYYRQQGASSWTQFSSPGANVTSETITGLSKDTTYEVYIENYTEHVSSSSNQTTGKTYLTTSRSLTSHASQSTSSSIAVLDILESVTSHATAGTSTSTRSANLVAAASSWATAGSAGATGTINLGETVTSTSSPLASSSLRVVDFNEGVTSHAGPSATTNHSIINLSERVGSHSRSKGSEAQRVVDLKEGVTSAASTVSSDVSLLLNLIAAVESHSAAGDASSIRVTDVLASTLSASHQLGSASDRDGINFEGRESDAAYVAQSISQTMRMVDLVADSVSWTARSGAAADRDGINYEGRESDASFSPASGSGSIRVVDLLESVESHALPSRSFTYNDRTSLELIDHEIYWNDSESFWYTNWFKESKILGQEDTLAIRSLVVPDAKEPAAIVALQYDGNGNGTVDETSDPVYLGSDQDVYEVSGVPIDEDGYYRVKIMEYSGYNSLYAIDTAIIH